MPMAMIAMRAARMYSSQPGNRPRCTPSGVGRTIQYAPYSTIPNPPAKDSRTKQTRTMRALTPMWSAIPRVTPPSTPSSGRR